MLDWLFGSGRVNSNLTLLKQQHQLTTQMAIGGSISSLEASSPLIQYLIQTQNQTHNQSTTPGTTGTGLSAAKTLELCTELVRHKSGLGDDYWFVLEMGVNAALDTHQISQAEEWIKVLKGQFGEESRRVMLLQGMLYEAESQFDKANSIYDKILSLDETNIPARKRKIAVLLEKGKQMDAVKALNEFLGVFMTDTEAWEQLLHLYMDSKQYEHALFCCEELILLRPSNFHYLIQYADVYVEVGGYENLVLARKYYLKAFELCPNSRKALRQLERCHIQLEATLKSMDKRVVQDADTSGLAKELVTLLKARVEMP